MHGVEGIERIHCLGEGASGRGRQLGEGGLARSRGRGRHGTRLEARSERRVERRARVARHRQADGDDHKVGRDAEQPPTYELLRAHAFTQQRVHAVGRHEEATILERHLAILEQAARGSRSAPVSTWAKRKGGRARQEQVFRGGLTC